MFDKKNDRGGFRCLLPSTINIPAAHNNYISLPLSIVECESGLDFERLFIVDQDDDFFSEMSEKKSQLTGNEFGFFRNLFLKGL